MPDDDVSEVAVKQERPGKPHHHVLIGVAGVVVALSILTLAWIFWGEHIHTWCFGDSECAITGEPEPPFQREVHVPDSSSLPATPNIQEEISDFEITQ